MLKLTLAEDLFRLSELSGPVEPLADDEQLLDSDDTEEMIVKQVQPVKVRLDKTICHFPIEKRSRSNCTAHIQRKATRFFCAVCKKYLCPGKCWKLYHSKKNYLYDDQNIVAKVVHRRATDWFELNMWNKCFCVYVFLHLLNDRVIHVSICNVPV